LVAEDFGSMPYLKDWRERVGLWFVVCEREEAKRAFHQARKRFYFMSGLTGEISSGFSLVRRVGTLAEFGCARVVRPGANRGC
jgi:hypothetical protein